MGYGRNLLVAATGLPAGTLISIWLIGDLSYDGPADGGLDYAVRPVEVSTAVVTAAGAVAMLALVVTAMITRRSRGARWVLVTLAAAGAAVGLLYRTMTAGVIGANIGAGIAFFLVPPLVLVLLVTAAVLGVRLRPTERKGRGPGPRLRTAADRPA